MPLPNFAATRMQRGNAVEVDEFLSVSYRTSGPVGGT